MGRLTRKETAREVQQPRSIPDDSNGPLGIASEILRTRERLAELDRRLEELLADDPAARIVRTMPGMGIVFTAEFLAEVGNLGRFASADSLAAAERRSCAQFMGQMYNLSHRSVNQVYPGTP